MENKINIAEILRDMPKGTKLYSTIFGDVTLDEVREYGCLIVVEVIKSGIIGCRLFAEDGLYLSGFPNAEPTLFPSRNMRDWTKFFKRGDVVINKTNGATAIFGSWENDDYTTFNTTIKYRSDSAFAINEVCMTMNYSKATDEQRAELLPKLKKHYNGKYNPETLQVEPVKVVESKCPFKPFDKVLARCNEDSVWRCELFSHYNTFNKQYTYVCLSSVYKYCIPYEGNQHLLGTTNDPK